MSTPTAAPAGEMVSKDELLAQKRRKLSEVEQEIKQLPELTKQVEDLNTRFESLHKKVHEGQPVPKMPEFQPTPVADAVVEESDEPEIAELDMQIKQYQAQMPVVQERRAHVQWLEDQIAQLEAEVKKP
ncbi:MAG: hypothetical protein KC910_33395 [Candidatus Eremiobacteraeota bacterium]|nr:hypothetical protein [Candidatus Eremiobacteraeota bacterium]